MKIACVQSNVVFKDPDANAQKAIAHLIELKKQGVDLVLFPEAYLTGYCFDSEEDVRANAIEADSAPIQCLRQAIEKLDILTIVGFAERAASDEKDEAALYNSAVVLEPGKEPIV